ncbi:hypothetical protein BCR33DRAFT_452349 [Rhizoclosmatium globosum]|uniref:HTH La-type RNA-binding domain-containing protein n=1 Tax=Rhizoclosmatium globosum TaxID=329046 RepID=A0A1Y2CWR7_9FUNG|nr:hypothetical protein BCR33DRAFT_452349 [Rhizoclosmatium globosum]|eukprot:ORY51326.1 hypothetical protein BCR33DRAFT_452349 [Rhizoclosmatium globosum]
MDVDIMPQELAFLSAGLHSLVSVPSMTAQQAATLDLLDAYFCNKEVKNLQRLASTQSPNCGWQHGWVPLTTIAGFKTVKQTKISVNLLREVAGSIVPGAFELSPDGLCIRRCVSFNQRAVESVVKNSNTLSASCCLFHGIPIDAVQLDFLSFIREKFGAITRHQFTKAVTGTEDGDFQSCYIQFTDASVMIKLLANTTIPTSYEDSSLTVEASIFPTEPTFTFTFDLNHPSLTSRDVRSKPIKQVGQAPVQASAVLGYPLNRILKFGPVADTTQSVGFTASSLQALARSEFEKLAPVVECVLRPGEAYGFVRFKRAVAKEIGEMVMRHHGVELGVGEKVKVVALEGEAERLFYEVAKEKEKIVAAANEHVIALNATKKVKEARKKVAAVKVVQKRQLTAAMKRRQATRIAERKAELKKEAEVVGQVKLDKGKKRMMVDDGEEAGNDADEKASRVIFGTRQKKAKVDDLEDLVKGMTAFS